jgi:phosphorylcholine metabolism protein LicD
MPFNKEAGLIMLLTLSEVLDELAIPHFLIQGTALGAYRDHGFVPTERDIDIGILIEHFAPRVGDICKALLDRNIEVETWHRHYPFAFCHTIVAYCQGAKADLVGLMKHNGQRFTCTPNDPVNVPEPYAIVHKAELLENYQTVEMFGKTFTIPCPIEEYLATEYGPGWKTPADDHVSRSRVYDYLKGLPDDFYSTIPVA